MKLCVATGTRAEYGILKSLIYKIDQTDGLTLQILVTGSHLSPEFGQTYKEIEEDGFVISDKIEMLLSSDTPNGIAKSMGVGIIGFSDSLSKLSPDFLVILGDRFEMLALASVALVYKIPIIHISGGDVTEGAYDDSIRHAITKMSHLHFPSTSEYRDRIIQLGERPETVFNVGALGLDNVKNLNLLTKQQIEVALGVKFKKHNYLIAFHPETLSDTPVEEQFNSLLQAITKQQDSYFIFTYANADADGRLINRMIDAYVSNCSNCAVFASLGTTKFLSVMKFVDAVVGNSSSGIVEAPSLNTATINIGNRQKGRIQALSVVNCNPDTEAILNSFLKVTSPDFKEITSNVINPYGDGNATNKIIDVLKQVNLNDFKVKHFYDIKQR